METQIDVRQRFRSAKPGMLLPRALAQFIDVAILIGAFALLQRLTDYRYEDGVAINFLAALALLSYFVICEWRWRKTVGKSVLGISVVDANGESISFAQSLGRNLIRPFEAIVGSTCIVGAVLILFTKYSQRLGDLAAGTYVIPSHLLLKRAPANKNI
ncbi:RDD family protein [Duganella sp. Root336D2]|uniref:RDD family protein n=1 Tax=Duganella sp. Root336D2 TaxID=1736518 RepID=UPI0006FBB860|nr:RDD family protein [Duganella sp. Root336D2]KQV61884.1 hypothetical protein ASD07_03410 [Duganella sp. Root336D2]